MRYIIETALLHGSLLNRTVIIPSFVYARSCEPEHSLTTCSLYAPQLNTTPDWRHLPPDEHMAWRLPIRVMLDLPLLRRTQPVVTVAEYLRIHGVDEGLEMESGAWDKDAYHARPSVFALEGNGQPPTLEIVENAWYEPHMMNRVDYLPADMKLRGGWSAQGGAVSKGEKGQWAVSMKTPAAELLESAMQLLPDRPRALAWDVAARMLSHAGHVPPDIGDEALASFLAENGWEVVYTFNGA